MKKILLTANARERILRASLNPLRLNLSAKLPMNFIDLAQSLPLTGAREARRVQNSDRHTLACRRSAVRTRDEGGEQMLFQLDEKLNGGVRTVRVYRSGVRGGAERRLSQEDFYDRQGRKTDEVRYGRDIKVAARRVLSYDAVGRLEEAAEYAAGGALINKKRYAYAGGRVEEVTYPSDGSPSPGRTVNSFDKEGRLVSTETVGGEPPSLKVVAAYRDGGKTVEVTVCAGDLAAGMIAPGESGPVVLSDAAAARMKGVGPCGGGYLTSRTVFILDERGLITEAATYTHDNILINREGQAREFDARGNWVKETRSRWNAEMDSFEPFEVRERVITYY